MEHEQKIPDDITRRQFLGGLLSLPPVLLALTSCDMGSGSGETGSGGPSTNLQVTWSQADALAIDVGQAWHAGHVTDILSTGDGILVATETGGVWRIFRRLSNGEAGALHTTPLSDKWDNPDVNCLAADPESPRHIYAGCAQNNDDPNNFPPGISMLYETDPTAFDPFNAWSVVEIPQQIKHIFRIGIFKTTRCIVLASDAGVFWAFIPPWPPSSGSSPAPTRTYTWSQAQGAALQNVTGLAEGPNESVVLAADGQGIFYGHVPAQSDPSPTLTLQAAQLDGVDGVALDVTTMRWPSLASCANNLSVMYAVSAAPPDSNKYSPISLVLSSPDGGQSWTLLNPTMVEDATPLSSHAGSSQEGYNICIAVSPDDPSMVAIGWQYGTFLSQDSGQTWRQFDNNPALHPALHADVHALHFVSSPSGGQPTLYIGSDGGVISTTDLGQTFGSAYNQRLLNLQGHSSALDRQFWGTFSASPVIPGLVATGLQDNGVVYSLLGKTPWKAVEQGDGALAMFLSTGQLLHNPVGGPVSISTWDGTGFHSSGVIPIVPSGGGAPDAAGTSGTVEIVETPQWRNQSNHLMFAVAGDQGPLFGLFADDTGENAYWQHIGNQIPPNSTVWSLASGTGHAVFIGTAAGIFSLNTTSGTLRALPIQRRQANALHRRIVVISDTLAFAIYNSGTNGTILRWNGKFWTSLASPESGLPAVHFFGLAVTDAEELFAATDNQVLVSTTHGDTWQVASTGLPKRPHCAELRFVKYTQGGTALYLSTYGRSVWKANIER